MHFQDTLQAVEVSTEINDLYSLQLLIELDLSISDRNVPVSTYCRFI